MLTGDPTIDEALRRDLTIDITTIGRRSGRPRRIEIWFLNIEIDREERIFITGTPGPRDWLANVAANPDFTFHLKESVAADLAATASVVTDEPTRRRVLSDMAAQWYQDRSAVDSLVASAPLVEVRFH